MIIKILVEVIIRLHVYVDYKILDAYPRYIKCCQLQVHTFSQWEGREGGGAGNGDMV